jgi:hypothetical protein
MREAWDEAVRQDAKWGDQSQLPDGTGATSQPLLGTARALLMSLAHAFGRELADSARSSAQRAARLDNISWADVLLEEVFEAAAESDEERLLEELNQVAAVAMQWRAAVRRRRA